MSNAPEQNSSSWTKTPFTNLLRYEPSGTYFARLRVKGSLIRKSLKTTILSVAKLRLSDLEKQERQIAVADQKAAQGKMTFQQCATILQNRLAGDASKKPKTKAYYDQRMNALLRSWPGLGSKDVKSITKNDCLDWATRFSAKSSSVAFNNTVGVLRWALDIAMEFGTRYDNPAAQIQRVQVRPKKLRLPEFSQFQKFVAEIESGGGRESNHCADLVRFLAYSGCRISEAANVTWADVDFKKKEIIVKGDPIEGTKNSLERRIPMIPDMHQLLQRLDKSRPARLPTEPVMQVQECPKAMDRAAKAIGMVRITHHDLRHLFATRCIESGVDIPTISRWLGHKDGGALAMKVYGHLRDQHSAAMAQKVTFSAQA